MNKNQEIQKIKVNDGTELITKAKEYKNSGGEWKLREKYRQTPGYHNYDSNYSKWGIVIANEQQKVEIYSENINKLLKERVENPEGDEVINVLDEAGVRKELNSLFPAAKPFAFQRNTEKMDINTNKEVERQDGKHELYRYLVAENSWHLKKILHKYIRDNETKIYQSANPHFSDWVEIIDGQDGNMYLYVGEKNSGGGREIKIGIKKNEFEKGSYGGYDAEKMLENNWGLFTIDRPRTPTEEKDYYYQALSYNGNYWTTLDRNWEKTCRFMLEEARRLYEKRKNFLEQEPNSETRNQELSSTQWMIVTLDKYLAEMKKNHPDWYNNYDKTCPDCGNRMCCHHWGNCGKSKNQQGGENLFHDFLIIGNQTSTSPQPNQKSNQISETEKKQLLQYFLTHNITKIIWDNGKIVIEYNGSQKGQKEANNQELEKYKQFIQSHPNHSISLSELQNNTTSNPTQSNPNKNNHQLAIGLALGAGAVILGGVIVYFIQKRNKK